MIDQPFHQLTHRLRPDLIVEHPEYASSLPGRVEGALAEIPENVVIHKVGQRSHVGSQLVHQLVQRPDDVAPLTVVQTQQILVELAVELVVVLALTGYATVAAGARLIRKDHAPESAVEELMLIETASRVRVG